MITNLPLVIVALLLIGFVLARRTQKNTERLRQPDEIGYVEVPDEPSGTPQTICLSPEDLPVDDEADDSTV